MFNITKSGSSLLITSNDNSQFPWKDGKMSIPMNSVTYVIDESDYIAFRSISNNDILFTALIDEIQIEGESITKDTIIEKFDAVANASVDLSNYYTKEETDALVDAVEESDPVFEAWKNADNVIVGNGATVLYNGIAIGENATINNGIAIGKNNSGYGIIIGSDVTEIYGGIAIGDNISNPTDAGVAIGLNAKINTKNPDDTENAYGIAIGVASIAYDKNDVAIGMGVSTDATYTTNFNNILKGNASGFAFVKAADGSFVQINTEWTGTQSQYDALTTKYDTITYNIIEG